ncbi:MAG: hypothetical protein WCC48_03560 [Anaeromyxobacteraceae bacterium]
MAGSLVAVTFAAAGLVTAVTTTRCGSTSRGATSAATAFASRFDAWKKRGNTCVTLSRVTTLATSMTLDRQRRPSRRGAATSGNRWISSAAVLRWKAAPAESFSSRCRK